MKLGLVATILSLAANLAACQQSASRIEPPKKAASDQLAAGWSKEQMNETLAYCGGKADSSLSDGKKSSFCRCIFKALSTRWTYEVYKVEKEAYFEKVVTEKEQTCLAAETPGVDPLPEVAKWSEEQYQQARVQCDGDVRKLGLGLDDDKSGKTCECLLKDPKAEVKWEEFQPLLAGFVKEKVEGGQATVCLGAAGFDPDRINTRKWHTPSRVANYEAGPLERASAAFDDDGHIGIIWVLVPPTGDPQVWSRLYDKAAGGWQSPSKIGTGRAFVGSPRVYFQDGGAVRAFWAQAEADGPAIFTSANQGTTWTPPEILGGKTFAGASGDAFSFEAARDGSVTVAYTRSGALEVMIYDKTGTWGSPLPASSANASDAQSPRVALGTAGEQVIASVASVGGKSAIELASFKDGKFEPRLPGDALAVEGQIEVSIERPEGAVATWIAGGTVKGARYTELVGWDKTSLVADGASLSSPRVVTSSAGSAVAAWIDGGRKLGGASFHPFKGWQKAVPVADTTADVGDMHLTRSVAGKALLIWTEQTGGKAGQVWICPFE